MHSFRKNWKISFPYPQPRSQTLSFSSFWRPSSILDDKGGKGERAWVRGCHTRRLGWRKPSAARESPVRGIIQHMVRLQRIFTDVIRILVLTKRY